MSQVHNPEKRKRCKCTLQTSVMEQLITFESITQKDSINFIIITPLFEVPLCSRQKLWPLNKKTFSYRPYNDCVLSRALVCTMWMITGHVCLDVCSPPAVGTVTPTVWWTAVTGKT